MHFRILIRSINTRTLVIQKMNSGVSRILIITVIITYIVPIYGIQKSCTMNEGIVVDYIGKIALTQNTGKINILLKIPKVELDLPNCTTKTPTNNFSESISALNNDLSLFLNKTHEFILTLHDPLDTNHHLNTKRHKRSIFAALGMTLLSGIGFVTSEIQFNSINTHLRQTQIELNQVKSILGRSIKRDNIFFEKTIGVITEFENQIISTEDSFSCNMLTSDAITRYRE